MTVYASKPEINIREKLKELDKPSGIAGEAMLRAKTPQEQFELIGAGRRRLNINGDMAIWQRGTTHTGFSAGSATYHVDRYQSYNSSAGSGVSSVSRSTDAPDGFSYSYRLEVTTADTALGSTEEYSIYHYFEGNSVGDLKKGTIHAKHTTVSFWVKTNTPGLYCIEMMDSDNGNRMVSTSYTISKPDVWEYKVVTFPPDRIYQLTHDNTKSIHVAFWLGAGSSYSSSADGLQEYWGGLAQTRRAVGQTNLYGTVGNTFQITGIQVEAGKTATPFEYRSYGEELALCQRYYQVLVDQANGHRPSFAARSNSTSTIEFGAPLSVPIARSDPTILYPNYGIYLYSGGARITDSGGSVTLNAGSHDVRAGMIYLKASGFSVTDDRAYTIGGYDNDFLLAIDSEL